MKKLQTGFFLMEAMVAVLIFAFGILGMVAMGGAAVGAQSDARYRTDAASLADEIASTMALNVLRANATTIQTSLLNFQHQTAGTADALNCVFTGPASADLGVAAWAAKANTTGPGLPGLPGATSASTQILVDTASFNRVTINLCWKPKTGDVWRHHTLVTYIN